MNTKTEKLEQSAAFYDIANEAIGNAVAAFMDDYLADAPVTLTTGHVLDRDEDGACSASKGGWNHDAGEILFNLAMQADSPSSVKLTDDGLAEDYYQTAYDHLVKLIA